jgi:tRNA(Glu) U13 pseudouridine synthase TruD
MTRAAGEVGRREQEALLATGVTPDDLARFADGERDAQPGSRRAYRAPLTFVGCEGGRDEHGEYVKCVFELPRGAFATVAMDEVMKPTAPPDQPDAGEPDDGEECS